ncbi:altronate oxidoreductase [Fulvitalea axinellae]|uniref:Altronate oxidoreductase n=1 Tax=Fulvitalea axinellae TaxID=1182444 RepID=A0AAU9CVJ4_9BACT|nr:altronate oxidoreductase [Fulvitalea axinellae]
MRISRALTKAECKHPVRVLQFGEGNFLRAFVDWIIQEMNDRGDFGAAVKVVQPIDFGRVKELNEQEGLYNLFLTGLKDGQPSKERKLVDCVVGGINPYQDYDAYLAEAENPDLRFVVSNTTEAGIVYKANDKIFNNPPTTFPGKLLALLHHRFKHFEGDMDKGLHMIPCELIDRNGETLKECLLQFADRWSLSDEFKTWLVEANTFSNTLVDRIVPGYPKDSAEEILKELGYDDQLLVEGENFHFWAIQAPEKVREEFPADKTGLNVVFTDDLAPYRTRKVRILNGTHTAMVPVGLLAGIETVRETVEDENVGRFVAKAMEDIVASLDLPGQDVQAYADDVLTRFRNPYIRHFLKDISLNSFPKYKTRVLPSVLETIERGGEAPESLLLPLAAYVVLYNEPSFEPRDNADIVSMVRGDKLAETEEDFRAKVEAVMGHAPLWGDNLADVAPLKEAVLKLVMEIKTEGILKFCGAKAGQA